MKGFWIPISKALAVDLPRSCAFSRIEAAFSLQLDYDRGESVTVAGMAARWGWSRGKVLRFLDELGLRIEYPESTTDRQNQRGQITVQIPDRSQADDGQIKFIDNKEIADETNRSRSDDEQKTDRSQGATKENRRTKKKNSPSTPPLFDNDSQEPPPCFSAEFIAGPWAEWCRTKKGGPYRNAEATRKQLDYLFELSGGDERRAAEALKEAFRAGWQAFKWVFKNDQNKNPYDHDQSTYSIPPAGSASHGARNLDRLDELYYGTCDTAARGHVADSAQDGPPAYGTGQ
jgi:hypothetical protein